MLANRASTKRKSPFAIGSYASHAVAPVLVAIFDHRSAHVATRGIEDRSRKRVAGERRLNLNGRIL
jgi:hypothetical protein